MPTHSLRLRPRVAILLAFAVGSPGILACSGLDTAAEGVGSAFVGMNASAWRARRLVVSEAQGTDAPVASRATGRDERPSTAWRGDHYLAAWLHQEERLNDSRPSTSTLRFARYGADGAPLDVAATRVDLGNQFFDRVEVVQGSSTALLVLSGSNAATVGYFVAADGSIGAPVELAPRESFSVSAAWVGDRFVVVYQGPAVIGETLATFVASDGHVLAPHVLLFVDPPPPPSPGKIPTFTRALHTVAPLGDGFVVLAASAPVTFPGRFGLRRFDTNGVALGARTEIGAWSSAVIVRAPGGALIAAQASGKRAVQVADVDAEGNATFRSAPVLDEATAGKFQNASLGVGADGVALLSWTSRLGVSVARLPTSGAIAATEVTTLPIPSPSLFSVVSGLSAALAPGGAFVTWLDDEGFAAGTRLELGASPSFGTPRPLTMAVNRQRNPAVASDGESFLVAWEDSRGAGGRGLYGMRFDGRGLPVDREAFVIDPDADDQSAPALTFDGEAYVVAYGRSGRDGSTILTRRVIAGPANTLVVSDPTVVTRWPDGVVETPSLASSGNETMVAYTRPSLGATVVFAVRVSRDGRVLDETPSSFGDGGSVKSPRVVWNGSAYFVGWHDAFDNFGVRIGSDGVPLDATPLALPASFLPAPIASAIRGETLAFGDEETARFGADGARLSTAPLPALPEGERRTTAENVVWNGDVAIGIGRSTGSLGLVARAYDASGRLVRGELGSGATIENVEVGQRSAGASTRCGRVLLAYSALEGMPKAPVERLRVRLLQTR